MPADTVTAENLTDSSPSIGTPATTKWLPTPGLAVSSPSLGRHIFVAPDSGPVFNVPPDGVGHTGYDRFGTPHRVWRDLRTKQMFSDGPLSEIVWWTR